MKDQKDKVKEPFPPEATPNPPQIIDPSKESDQGKSKQPLKTQPKNQQAGHKSDQSKSQPKKKLLGESETEIDDETTI
jgi:hypothetical protein